MKHIHFASVVVIMVWTSKQRFIFYFSFSWNVWKFFSWNVECWASESWIQLNESWIPLTIEIQNLSSTDKGWNPVPGIRNPQCGIQNPKLSCISLHGAIAGQGHSTTSLSTSFCALCFSLYSLVCPCHLSQLFFMKSFFPFVWWH